MIVIVVVSRSSLHSQHTAAATAAVLHTVTRMRVTTAMTMKPHVITQTTALRTPRRLPHRHPAVRLRRRIMTIVSSSSMAG